MLRNFLSLIQSGSSKFELVHASHERWPIPSLGSTPNPLRISVLDSSFNPPTLAHLALLNSRLPRVHSAPSVDYDAKLLLLSIRNADKQLKPGDASYLQRIEMMSILANDVSPNDKPNIAIAIIDEPTFVGKSTIILDFLRRKLSGQPATMKPRLTFLQGIDTLERLLSPKYYASEEVMLASLRKFFSSEGDNSNIVCARRAPNSFSTSSSAVSEEEAQNGDIEAKIMRKASEFVDVNQIEMIDIGADEQTLSSSECRTKILAGDVGWKRFVSPNIASYIVSQQLYIGPDK